MAKILVVDDEIKIREIIKEYAEFEGYEVAQAEDGMQAVEMVKNQDFDIIIMDVMMPKLDGYSACKEIRKIKQIPVIMLSARGEEYDKLFGFAGRKKLCGRDFSDHTPRELSESIKKTFGADMAESFAECEKIYEKARFSRLAIIKEEIAVVKNFADQAKKAKKLKGQKGAEK